ncbi:hypothetical protein R9X47_04065 [Wukongibacter baidiensis]|uniref:hypothetical protein n=1 Tax=Wukongibacter baidiensis TaxID=1723361 RepID=UPI003D7FE52B
MSSKGNGLEKVLWSIAIPGFGQLLNKAYFKGMVLITLEIFINLKANLNTAIMFSFHGNIQRSIEVTNFYWLMYYPCIYFFSIWDAYKDSVDRPTPYLFLPFVLAAYFSTVGVIYSKNFEVLDTPLGPVWLPLIAGGLGLSIGFQLMKILLRKV